MEEQQEQKEARQTGPNWLALGLKVFGVIIAFNIVATLVFYFFIAPHMTQFH